VIVNRIACVVAAQLRQELDKANLVSVTIDISTRKELGRRRAET